MAPSGPHVSLLAERPDGAHGLGLAMVLVVLALVVGAYLACPQRSLADEPNTLTVGDNDWPPYFFSGRPDRPKGLAVEVLEMCLPETGYEYEFKVYPIKRRHVHLEEGTLDVHVSSYTKSRESYLVFGREPVFSEGYKPVVRADSDIEIGSLRDLDGLRLGHLAGLTCSGEFATYVERRKKDGSLVTTPVAGALLKMLLKRRIDVFVLTEGNVRWLASEMGVLDKVRILDYEVRESKDYVVVVSRKSKRVKDIQRFLDAVDQCIRAAKADGRHAELLHDYGLEE